MKITNKCSWFPLLGLVLLFLSPFSVFSKEISFENEGRFQKRNVPEGYTVSKPLKMSVKDENVELTVYSRGFKQGDAVYMEMLSEDMDRISEISMTYGGKKMLFTVKDWGCSGFFALNPDEKPSEKKVELYYKYKRKIRSLSLVINIENAQFPVSNTPLLFTGKYSNAKPLPPETLKYIEECVEKKKAAFATNVPDRVTSVMSHPRDMHYITSQFWSKRIYSRYVIKNGKRSYLKPDQKIHRGIDLRGAEGTPCFALMKGEIVLTDLLYYEGNMIIINHGNRVFSYYMHLKQSLVKKGDIVEPGQQIAEVGSTGRSTAAHLHVSLVINGIQVDPLSVLSLPVRD